MRVPIGLIRAGVAIAVSLGLVAGSAVSALAGPAPTVQTAALPTAAEPKSDEWFAGQLRTRFGIELSTDELLKLLATGQGDLLRAYVTDAEFGETAEAPTDVSLRALGELANYIPNLFGASYGPDYEGLMMDVIKWDIGMLEKGNLDSRFVSALNGSVKAVEIAKHLTGVADRVNTLAKMGLEAYSDYKYRQVLSDYKERRNGGMTPEAAFADVEEFLTTEYINNVAEMRDPCTWLGLPLCTLAAREAHLPNARNELKSDLAFTYNAIQLARSADAKEGVKSLVTKLSKLIAGYSSQHADFGLIAVQTGKTSITLINNGPASLTNIKLRDGSGKELAASGGIGAYGRTTVPDNDWASLFTADAKFTFSAAGVDAITRPASEVRRTVWLDSISVSAGANPAERLFKVSPVSHYDGTTGVAWDLGDATPAAGSEITHAFKCYGTYNVQATAQHGPGTMTRKVAVTINAPWTVDWSTEDGEYAAATGVAVKLLADPSIPRDTGLEATWTFGDGGTASGFEVEHAFPTKGTPTVTLQITDPNTGCPAYAKAHPMQVARTDEWITLPFTIDDDMVLTSRVAGYVIPQRLWYGSPHGTTVSAGAKLTIPPGVRIKGSYDPDAWGRYHNPLVVHGELEVRGSASSPVEWTSWRDDALGGDANRDGDFTKPEAGDYLGVVATAGSTVTMNYVSVKYSANFLDVQDGATATVNNLTVRNSSGFVYGALNGSYATGIVSATGSGSLQLTGSDIENTANGSGYAIAAYNSPGLRVSGSTLRGSGTGLAVTGDAGPTIANTAFVGFDEPVRTSAAASGLPLRGVTVTGGLARITVQPGQLAPGTTTWSGSLPYILGGEVTVPQGSTLRLSAGTAVKSYSGSSWFGVTFTPLRVAGTLYMDGSPTNPVQWTSLHDDSVRGRSDSTIAEPAPGDWAGVVAQDGSAVHITGLRARFAAQIVAADPGAVVTVRDSSIEQSNADRMRYEAVFRAADAAQFELTGISVDGAGGYQPLVQVSGSAGEPLISNSTFSNAQTAVDLRGSVHATIGGTTFRNVRSSVLVQPATSGVTMSGTKVDGGLGRIVVSGGELAGTTEWNADLPYVVSDQLTVPAAATLNIGPGVVLKSLTWMGPWSVNYRPVKVFGSLALNGTGSQPVRWTSWRDPAVGGPTEDQSTVGEPTTTDWVGITANEGASVSLSHVQATFARTLLEAQPGSNITVTDTSVSNSDGQGYGLIRDNGAAKSVIKRSQFSSAGYGPALVAHGGQPDFDDVTVRSAGQGIEIGGAAKPIIRKSRLLADGYQIVNYTGTPVDAGSNWWGSENGPSTGATGVAPYFGAVAFDPWCLEETCMTVSTMIPASITAPGSARQTVRVDESFAAVKLHAEGANGGPAAGTALLVKLSGPAAFAAGARELELVVDDSGNVAVPGPTAGTQVGAVTLTVAAKAAPGLSPFVLDLGDVSAGEASAIDIVSGGGQSVSPGSDLGTLAGRVVDGHGNAVSGAEVDFALEGPAAFGNAPKARATSASDGLVQSPAITAADTAGDVNASVSLVGIELIRSEFPKSTVTALLAKPVTPAAVVFTDKDGTTEDSYTVPATVGVDYLVGEKVVPAGTYPGTGEVTVTAKAKPDYVLSEGAASWTATFKATPLLVTPAAVVFTDKEGMGADTYTVPATEGVAYLLGDKVIPAGTYPGTGTVTVTARPTPDYALADGAAASWTATFKATPYVVTPAAVTFADKDGTAQDRYTVPSTQGVDYLVGGKIVAAGSYLGAGTVTVTAKAKPDYVLKASTVSSWSLTFKGTFRFTSVVGTGDLNGDRKADVLVRDSSGALWLYPGNGRGGWLTRIKAGTGWNGFTSIVGPGDLNSDGKADILARDTAGALWLYPGNGRGGWLARIKAGTGWNGFTAIVGPGDMNGDGKADVLARDTGGTLWLYPGNGRGGWLARIKAGTGWNGFTAVVGAGDMNGDRKSDVLARDSGGTLWLYRGNGRGGFLSRTSAGPGWNAMTFIVSAREFNGDGRNDVLAVDSAGVLWLYRGNGTGGWLGRVQAATGWN